MQRRKRIKGMCGFYWVQSEPTQQGNISMECEHEDGYCCITLRSMANEECLNICEDCKYKQ